MNINQLKYNDQGLIPAIVQESGTGKLLMMAWMSGESLEITMKEGFTCFFSRSRGVLWRKGETSGNTQRVVSITADCDADCLLVEVIPSGPACHTGNESCFFQPVFKAEDIAPAFSLKWLYQLLEERKKDKVEGSYTSYLFEKGEDKILKKVGEECTEVVIAAKNNDDAELVYELADLCYHSMVLMAQKKIPVDSILNELASRHIVDKKVKQEKMG